MSATNDAPQARSRRRWFQFRLADLLMATALVAVLVVILEPEIERWLDWLRNLTASTQPAAPEPGAPQPSADEATVVMDANGAISLDGKKLTAAELPAALQAAFQQLASRSKPPRVHISCDADLPYEKLMNVADTIAQAGCTQISIGAKTAGPGPP